MRFDPKTEAFRSRAISSRWIYAGILRHMRRTRDGNLPIHQSSTNRILLVTIEGGKRRSRRLENLSIVANWNA